jgi:hypothetical protein
MPCSSSRALKRKRHMLIDDLKGPKTGFCPDIKRLGLSSWEAQIK